MALRSDATPVNELDATSCSVPSVSQSHSLNGHPRLIIATFNVDSLATGVEQPARPTIPLRNAIRVEISPAVSGADRMVKTPSGRTDTRRRVSAGVLFRGLIDVMRKETRATACGR
jgi:hypothetical protein